MKAALCILFIIISCGACSPVTIPKDTAAVSGWVDSDTYMVTAVGVNEGVAVDNARHQILKDIVDVRVRNNSRYTDIIKIQEEFEIPLRDGVIVKKIGVPEGIRIFFQIRDTGLREKFMRK